MKSTKFNNKVVAVPAENNRGIFGISTKLIKKLEVILQRRSLSSTR